MTSKNQILQNNTCLIKRIQGDSKRRLQYGDFYNSTMTLTLSDEDLSKVDLQTLKENDIHIVDFERSKIK